MLQTDKRAAIALLGALCLYLNLSAVAMAAEREVIVGFHQRPGLSEQALIHSSGGVVRRAFRLIPAMAAKLPERALENLRRHPRVAYVEADVTVSLIEPLTGGIEYDNAWGVAHIGSETAHMAGIQGTGVKVAVLDTAIDYTHPDLVANYVDGYDFVFNDSDPIYEGGSSHGTHVAGIVLAALNGTGVVGVAPQASLHAVRVLDGAGFGTVSWLIAGIEWAVMNNMDVANISIGLQSPMQSLQEACDAAYNAGLLLVAAAGNYLSGSGPVMYPAAYDSVIAVSATLMDDTAWFASASGPEIELAAPGAGIYSTVAGGGYDTLFGTSQASPHVAGVAALVLSSDFGEDLDGDGDSDHQDVRQQLQGTARDLGDPGVDDVFGYGLVNAAAAMPEPPVTHVVVTKVKGSPGDSTQIVTLTDARFEVTIVNDSLSKICVLVFEAGALVKDLSESFRFGKNGPQEVMFPLDATGTTYDVVFMPKGKDSSFADVFIHEIQEMP